MCGLSHTLNTFIMLVLRILVVKISLFEDFAVVERTFKCLFLCWSLIRINRFATLFSLIARIGEAGDSLGWRGEAEEKKREKQLVYKKSWFIKNSSAATALNARTELKC